MTSGCLGLCGGSRVLRPCHFARRCLRKPGNGVLSDPEVLDRAARGPEVESTVTRAGVIAMRPLLIHASSKCVEDLPRRVLHSEYVDRLELAPGIKLAVA